MKRTLVFLLLTGMTALSTVVISAKSSISQNIKQTGQIDLSLLVGEWGETDRCDQKRFIYMADGKYIQKINQGGTWETEYERTISKDQPILVQVNRARIVSL